MRVLGGGPLGGAWVIRWNPGIGAPLVPYKIGSRGIPNPFHHMGIQGEASDLEEAPRPTTLAT